MGFFITILNLISFLIFIFLVLKKIDIKNIETKKEMSSKIAKLEQKLKKEISSKTIKLEQKLKKDKEELETYLYNIKKIKMENKNFLINFEQSIIKQIENVQAQINYHENKIENIKSAVFNK